jgi:hypothetical protein
VNLRKNAAFSPAVGLGRPKCRAGEGARPKAQASAAATGGQVQVRARGDSLSLIPGTVAQAAQVAFWPTLKREGILERELAKVNAKIEWVPAFGAFSANFEAMNTGAINASGGAISPIVGALAHNLKFKVFAIADPSAQLQAGIIVPGDSPIKKREGSCRKAGGREPGRPRRLHLAQGADQ